MNRTSIIFNLCKNRTVIGTSKFFVTDKSALLSNIYIKPQYQHKGHGRVLLDISENTLKHKYNIDTIRALAWQPTGSTHVIDFYQKNGFVHTNYELQTYDDYVTQFDLHSLHNKGLSITKRLHP